MDKSNLLDKYGMHAFCPFLDGIYESPIDGSWTGKISFDALTQCSTRVVAIDCKLRNHAWVKELLDGKGAAFSPRTVKPLMVEFSVTDEALDGMSKLDVLATALCHLERDCMEGAALGHYTLITDSAHMVGVPCEDGACIHVTARFEVYWPDGVDFPE